MRWTLIKSGNDRFLIIFAQGIRALGAAFGNILAFCRPRVSVYYASCECVHSIGMQIAGTNAIRLLRAFLPFFFYIRTLSKGQLSLWNIVELIVLWLFVPSLFLIWFRHAFFFSSHVAFVSIKFGEHNSKQNQTMAMRCIAHNWPNFRFCMIPGEEAYVTNEDKKSPNARITRQHTAMHT